MVVELLGENLEEIMKSLNGWKFSLPTVLAIADQLVNIKLLKQIAKKNRNASSKRLYPQRLKTRKFLYRFGTNKAVIDLLDWLWLGEKISGLKI